MKLHSNYFLQLLLLASSCFIHPVLSLPYQLVSYSDLNSLPYDFFSSIVNFFALIKKQPVSTVYIDSDIISIYNLTSSTDSLFESWLLKQTEFSFNGILSNIGGIGIHFNNVSNGAVIASPSRVEPNYFYQWTRDAAITINSLVEYLQDHQDDLNSSFAKKIINAIESYIWNSHHLQRLDNKSGTWESYEGLGEPKFMPDGTTFDEHWGRPQRDGPGLRVITIANYLNFLVNNSLEVQDPKLSNMTFIYNEILKPDLTYIVQNWNKNGFDLWEEVDSIHLFTSLTMLKALKSGIKISETFNDNEFHFKLRIAFTSLKYYILVESGFKNPDIPYLIETPSLLIQGKRSGLDIASILACLRAHDINDITDMIDIPFSVSDSAVLSTLAALVTDMRYRYPINHRDNAFGNGVALGRYPEDIYDGIGLSEGNPWFISTASASEMIYKLVYYLYFHTKDLVITKDQYAFYSSFISLDPNTESRKVILPFNSQAFNETTLSLISYADSFLHIIKDHVDEQGHMSEQFNKYTGFMEGAENLTWSYGSFWSAVRWRRKANIFLDI